MKRLFTICSLTLAALSGAAHANINLASFGSGQFTVTDGGNSFSSGVQTATGYEVSGNDGPSLLYGTLPSAVDITGNDNFLCLTAIFFGTANTNFQIDLFDSAGNDRTYLGSFAAFVPNVQMTITLGKGVTTGAFDTAHIVGLELATAGGGSYSVDLTMKTLTASAVPEPSDWILLAVGLVTTFAFFRKRHQRPAVNV